MPSKQQRRDAERLRLQRQLEARRAREVARRRTTLIVSVVGTLVLLGGVIAIIAVFAGGSGTPPGAMSTVNPSPTGTLPAGKTPTLTAPPTATPTPTPPPFPNVPPPKACAKPNGTTATLDGVSVKGATDLNRPPKVSAKSTSTPKTLECGDLVVGKGKAAKPTSTVTVQYTGVLYKNGKLFDSSWSRGQPATFSLAQVVPGFTAGIAGHGKVAPMRAGGRRVMILPPALGYGSRASGPIPANSTLVFVVDLLKVSG